jgi:hypothetical protein
MKLYSKAAVVAIGVSVVLTFAPSAHAQLFEEKITLTFSAPVEIPGQLLPAGTYVFDSVQESGLTRIWSAGDGHIYASLFTVPVQKNASLEPDTVVLDQATEGNHERVDAWFYPGEDRGSRFIYRDHGTRQRTVLAKGMKDIVVGPEAVGVGAAHFGAHIGLAVFRAGKFMVT